MNTEYRVIGERIFSRELGSYQSYGILGVSMDGYLSYIPDISTLEHRVLSMAERFNRHGVSRHHFMDAVLDCMGE